MRQHGRQAWALILLLDEIMKPASADGMAALPNDVLIVEDDPLIALDSG